MEMNPDSQSWETWGGVAGGRLLITQERFLSPVLENEHHPAMHPWPTHWSPGLCGAPCRWAFVRKMKFSVRADNKQVLIAALVIIKIYLVDMASSVNKSCRW